MIWIKEGEFCTGCRVCELVCTYHLRGGFGLGRAGIRVWKYGRAMGKVQVHTAPSESGSSCDQCRGEEKPLCVNFCPSGILQER